MLSIAYKEADKTDLPAIARLLSNPETEEFWNVRVLGYYNREHHPQKALSPRIIFVATVSDAVVGVISGHLTTRFGCDGELQWINVLPAYRKTGIAYRLLHLLAEWFVNQKAYYICVDVGSEEGRNFYTRNSAENLNEHWMVWKNIGDLLNNDKGNR